MSILYFFAYVIIRFTFHSDVALNPDEVADELKVEAARGDYVLQIQPMLHFFAISFALQQWSFFLQNYDSLNRQMRLLAQAMSDIVPFMLYLVILLVYYGLSFWIFGVQFDDGDNYSQSAEYDKNFNDYPKVSAVSVLIFSVIRTGVGDLQPPSYDYWEERWKAGDKNWSQFYIYIIWLFWFAQILVIVICMLNFLIAIVSDSYANIMENDKRTQLEGRNTMSAELMQEMGFLEIFNKPITGIILATDTSGESEIWQGMAKTLKKKIVQANSALMKR